MAWIDGEIIDWRLILWLFYMSLTRAMSDRQPPHWCGRKQNPVPSAVASMGHR